MAGAGGMAGMAGMASFLPATALFSALRPPTALPLHPPRRCPSARRGAVPPPDTGLPGLRNRRLRAQTVAECDILGRKGFFAQRVVGHWDGLPTWLLRMCVENGTWRGSWVSCAAPRVGLDPCVSLSAQDVLRFCPFSIPLSAFVRSPGPQARLCRFTGSLNQ